MSKQLPSVNRSLFLPRLCQVHLQVLDCVSTKSLHGDSEVVVLILILKLLHMLVNVILANSPPFSVRNLFCYPNINIHRLKMYLAIVLGWLYCITTDAKSLVLWSTVCKIIGPMYCFKSIATVSKMCRPLQDQLQVLVEVFCIFSMWNMTLKYPSFLLSTLLFDHRGPVMIHISDRGTYGVFIVYIFLMTCWVFVIGNA